MELRGKTILIISPQSWGKMYLAKHNYAIELAARGNMVFFLNPPEQSRLTFFSKIDIVQHPIYEKLYLINHQLFFPYILKFWNRKIFDLLMRFHIKNIKKKIAIDVVWSFDLGNLYPFNLWGDSVFKIFHPIDEPTDSVAISAAKGAHLILSVTNEILYKYNNYLVPKFFVNHGISDSFLMGRLEKDVCPEQIRVGFAGNLLRSDTDRDTLLRIIDENQDCIFEFWGSYKIIDSNIGGSTDKDTNEFIYRLQTYAHVRLHGPVGPNELSTGLNNMDILLICYDINKDQSKGTNYHKVMEYLSTGNVIVSNNITTYQKNIDLLEMAKSRTCNDEIITLFKIVKNNLKYYNSKDKRKKRIDFACCNTYRMQINRIENIIYNKI